MRSSDLPRGDKRHPDSSSEAASLLKKGRIRCRRPADLACKQKRQRQTARDNKMAANALYCVLRGVQFSLDRRTPFQNSVTFVPVLLPFSRRHRCFCRCGRSAPRNLFDRRSTPCSRLYRRSRCSAMLWGHFFCWAGARQSPNRRPLREAEERQQATRLGTPGDACMFAHMHAARSVTDAKCASRQSRSDVDHRVDCIHQFSGLAVIQAVGMGV